VFAPPRKRAHNDECQNTDNKRQKKTVDGSKSGEKARQNDKDGLTDIVHSGNPCLINCPCTGGVNRPPMSMIPRRAGFRTNESLHKALLKKGKPKRPNGDE